MNNELFRWAPVGQHSYEGAAAAELVAVGIDVDVARRLAPLAGAIDRLDDQTPINPNWPGIGVVDVDDPRRPVPPGAFVLELDLTERRL